MGNLRVPHKVGLRGAGPVMRGISKTFLPHMVRRRFLTRPGMRFAAGAAGVTSIPVTTDLRLHYMSDVGITKDGGDLVSQWSDQTANADHLLQATGTRQPKWYADQVNGFPSIRSEGIDNFMTAAFTSISQPFHFFVVMHVISFVGTVLSGKSSLSIQTELQSGTNLLHSAGGGASNILTPGTSAWFLLQSHFSNVNASSFQEENNDGHQTGAVGTGRNLNSGFCCMTHNENPLSGADVEIAEIAFYTALKSGGDETALKAYFNAKYALGF